MTRNVESEQARESLRRAHGVRLVTPQEEGCAAADLPPGVYGFTGSPALASPLFAVMRYRNFEVHHVADDTMLIAFVTAAEAAALTAGRDPVHITAFPDGEGEADAIVAIPYRRIAHHRQYSVRNSAGIGLEVRPLAAATAV